MRQRKIKSIRYQFRSSDDNGIYSISVFETIADDIFYARCGFDKRKTVNMRKERMKKNRHPARQGHLKYKTGGLWV